MRHFTSTFRTHDHSQDSCKRRFLQRIGFHFRSRIANSTSAVGDIVLSASEDASASTASQSTSHAVCVDCVERGRRPDATAKGVFVATLLTPSGLFLNLGHLSHRIGTQMPTSEGYTNGSGVTSPRNDDAFTPTLGNGRKKQFETIW
jgi:hypothetical protein